MLLMSMSVSCFSVTTYAQQKKDSLVKEVNEDVWVPFLKGINEDIDDLYINVHAIDFYWVAAGNTGRVMNFKEYELDSKMVMQRRRDQGIRSNVEVRFLERNIKADFATEKCIFKFTSKAKDKEPETSFGIAQIFSRKDNGRWKMYLQYVLTQKDLKETYELATPL